MINFQQKTAIALGLISCLAVVGTLGFESSPSTSAKATSDINEAERPILVLQNSGFDEKLDENVSNDLSRFGIYSQLLTKQIEMIMDNELGLEFLQSKLKEIVTEKSTINYKDIIYQITDNIKRKISKVHTLIEENDEKIQEMFQHQFTTNVTGNNFGCCDKFKEALEKDVILASTLESLRRTPHMEYFEFRLLFDISDKESAFCFDNYKFNQYFHAWLNSETSCDSGSDVKRQFFTPAGPNLTAQFKNNIHRIYPQVKWQYFMSFLDIHIEYPAFMPPMKYCVLNTLNNEHYIRSIADYSRTKWIEQRNNIYWWHSRREFLYLNQNLMQRHRENLLASALPKPKIVILIIDHASSISRHQLNIARSVSLYILNTLSHRDRVAIVDLTQVVAHPPARLCQSKFALEYANEDTKYKLSRYIYEMEISYNKSNHYLGFQRAFDILTANFDDIDAQNETHPDALIAYVGRGMLASIMDAKPVMELISSRVMNNSYSVVINCYALIDETKPILYETSFLQEIAAMNFKKFKVPMPPANKIRTGLMIPMNNTENTGYILNGIYAVLPKTDHESNQLYMSLPHVDFVSKDIHISLSKAVRYRDHLVGVAGADISFFDFADDLINFAGPLNAYAFLLDAYTGKVLYHPVFTYHSNFINKSKPYAELFGKDHIFDLYILIEHIEPVLHNNTQLRRAILTKENGEETVQLENFESRGKYFKFLNDWQRRFANYSSQTYYWQRLVHTPYIVVMTAYDAQQHYSKVHPEQHEDKLDSAKFANIVNHRLEYSNVSFPTYCRHFNQLATLDGASLYLSPNAFTSPYIYEKHSDSDRFKQEVFDYIVSSGKGAKNPGLNSDIWFDVLLASQTTSQWMNSIKFSHLPMYVVRKYIATVSGAMLIYPGMNVHDSYKPSSRPWFQRALANPERTMLSSPYKDVSEAGFIVTLSRAIYRPNSTSQVWAIVGIDLTLSYLQKVLEQSAPMCQDKKLSCLLMDDTGYLVVHSSFSKPGHIAFVERQHITHREPQMMQDLLNQQQFVRKLSCNNFVDRTVQRYYLFNTSLVGILTSIGKNKKMCTKYKIISLQSTNVFLGVIDRSCDNTTTFCPCSMNDRLCLNCHRIEQTDCECPCECPLILKPCDGKLENEVDEYSPVCPIPMAPLQKSELGSSKELAKLDSCFERDCRTHYIDNQAECEINPGCLWCFVSNNRDRPLLQVRSACLTNELCSSSNTILQNEAVYNYFFKNPHSSSRHNIMITVLLLICLTILVTAVFRSFGRGSTSQPTRRPNNTGGANATAIITSITTQPPPPPPQTDFDPDNGGLFEPMNAPLMNNNSNLDHLPSPYQINTNYQRPRVESDYGYSTMTINDELSSEMSSVVNPKINKTLDSADSLSLISSQSASVEEDNSSSISKSSKTQAKQKKKRISTDLKTPLPVVDEVPPSTEIIC